MSAGTWRSFVRYLVYTGPDDGSGGQSDDWTTLGEAWTAIGPMLGRQAVDAGLLTTERPARFSLPYVAELVAERRALRGLVLPGGPIYAIKAVRDVGGRHIELECDAVEVTEP